MIGIAFLGLSLLAPAATEKTIEVPFIATDEAIIVKAVVNGKPVSLMFDTGFSGSVIIDSVMNIGKPTGKMNLQDFVGTFLAETVEIKSLKLGDKSIEVNKDMQAVMAPGERYGTLSYGVHIDGLMGFEVFAGETVEINFQNKKFIFYPPSFDITKKVPDNKRTFLQKMVPAGNDAVILQTVTAKGQKMYLGLDTGNAFYATCNRDVLERCGLWEAGRKPKFMRQSGVASGAVDSWTKKMTDMTIFGVPVKTSYWDIIDLPAAQASHDGTVGYQFLKNFNIVMDYQRRRVWLENFTGKVENEEPGDVGIRLALDERLKRVRVRSVAPESPAAKADIKVGDHVLAVDGKEIPLSIGFQKLWDLLKGKVGEKVKLDLSRDGRFFKVELTREGLYNE